MGLMRWSLLNRLNGDSNDNPALACRPYDTTANGNIHAEGGARSSSSKNTNTPRPQRSYIR